MIYMVRLTTAGHKEFNSIERCIQYTVSANSEEEARQIVSSDELMGGESIWKNHIYSSCTELDLNKKIITKTILTREMF